jgi:signal-transduction protein with cAMP-binding, CBS, and nucleotidyltransferase domain
MSLVRDIVYDRELFHVEEGYSVADVARRMAELHVGAIVVLNGDRLRGVFSERDLMKRVVLERRNTETTRVEAVMSTAVTTVDEEASLGEAMELMQVHNCRHLPVTRASRVIGFLSMRDLMNYELARKTEELHHMHAYVHGSV